MLGGLIMCHGDDFGLVLPPVLAPIQVVVVVVKDTDGDVARAASALVDDLKAIGVRVRLDDNVEQGFGWRATEWDLQGVPIRLEIGPAGAGRELRRCSTGATPATRTRWRIDGVVDEVRELTTQHPGRHARGGNRTSGRVHHRLHHARPGARGGAGRRRAGAVGGGRCLR